QRGSFELHSSTHGHVAQALPDTVDFGDDGLVWLLQINRIGVRHPARMASDPENFSTVSLGVEEVAANRATMVSNPVDAIALGYQAAVKCAQIVKGRDAHGVLVDEMRIVALRASPHEGDCVGDRLRISTHD